MSDTVLVTGATGLIGKNLISYLLDNDYKVIAHVRNIDKANKIFEKNDNLDFVVGDITETIKYTGDVDYIVHAASATSSRAFVEEPVEIISVALKGTENLLKFAKEKKVKSFVYLSTMEVYGHPETDEKITEGHSTNLDTMAVRSSYPESKRMCESICAAYFSEYGVPVKVDRLTQTFGTGVEYNDGRVFADFARCVIEKRDIILHTKGETKRSYLSVNDASTAIMAILLHGKNGEAYNVANEETYCSIYEMAEMVTHFCLENEIKVKIELDDANNYGFAPTLKMNLDTSKLKELGWTAKSGLNDMFTDLIESMKINNV